MLGDHARAIALATAVLATAEARGADGFAARARAELTRLLVAPPGYAPRTPAAQLLAARRVERLHPGDAAEEDGRVEVRRAVEAARWRVAFRGRTRRGGRSGGR